ncbi:hypothetical protein SEPCBS119000_002469 [Sporothrix epigloea]|uniref:beta-glucosidase n=1 Tax=Sporothrix epigloea TaxID=1892477 RepID=A0ABP0DJL3_9PEZI
MNAAHDEKATWPTILGQVRPLPETLGSARMPVWATGLRKSSKVPYPKTRRGMFASLVTAVLLVGAGLTGMAALPTTAVKKYSTLQARDAPIPGLITEDTHFYDQSPPVYPSPEMAGTGSWAVAHRKAAALVAKMTLEEQVSLTAGANDTQGCSGFISGIPRLGFPGLCLNDAGNGLRDTDFVSSWPGGVHVGASWNRRLTTKRAIGIAAEFKKKGVNVMLGPVVGPVGRTQLGGRAWEAYSVDPYLAGELVYETITGSQSMGVITSTKHFVGNEQETNRWPAGDVQSVSTNMDDRTMHELYLWPFQNAVLAGTGNIMCSYNRLNNSYSCANSKGLNGLLKTELGFQGFVVSDWLAQHTGSASALAGLDMAMPNDEFFGQNLVQAVQNGSVPASRVTDMATRIISAWYQMGQDVGIRKPGFGMVADLTQPHPVVDARNPADHRVLLDGAAEGHVLVKNTNNALPFRKPKFLSVFGYSAQSAPQNDFSPIFFAGWSVGLQAADFNANGVDVKHLPYAPNGTLYSGGGSGANSQTTVSSPFDALQHRAWEDGTQLFWDFLSQDPDINPVSDACFVFGNAWATEGYDRHGLQDNYTDTLIANVAAKCKNTIVVLHNAGVRLVDPWIDHPNVTAVIFAHLPGQASGKALVSLLYGEANPSGKLPYTVAKKVSDYGDTVHPVQPEGIFSLFPQANFTEGVYIDYRRFDAENIEPRFEFGFGLSYTTFGYSALQIAKSAPPSKYAAYPSGRVLQGGQVDLWDQLVTVTANLANTGAMGGAEVAQLYITLPGAGPSGRLNIPIRQLRGFEKTYVAAGQTVRLSFTLTRRDLSYWDVVAQKWHLPRGEFTVSVGSSSRKLPLVGTFTM